MRSAFVLLVVLALGALAGGTALAQTTAEPAGTPQSSSASGTNWSGSVSVFTYVLPDEENYGQPTLKLDRGWLHLEARFNYEDLKTGSAWVGYNFRAGDAVTLEIAPLVGAVFGNTTAVGAGYTGSLAWRRLDLSSETEFIVDTGSSSDSFLYTWSELGWSPADWFRTGLVIQRTKAYETAFDIQRGVFAGVALRAVDVTTYVFYAEEGRPTVVVGAGLSF